jgi:hypothetical protein
MIRSGPTVIFLILAFGIMIAAGAEAQAIYLLEGVYRSLEQLDDALAAGEISQEDYEQLLEAILQGCPDGCSLEELLAEESSTGETSSSRELPGVEVRFNSSFTQKLNGSAASRRYDRLEVSTGRVEFRLSTEHNSDGDVLLRSRSLEYRSRGVTVTAGSLDFECGTGLTIGHSNHHNRLCERADFRRSLRYPVSSRLDGLMVTANIGWAGVTSFGSKLQGEDHALRSWGVVLEIRDNSHGAGIVLLHQKLSSHDSEARFTNYIGPFLSVQSKPIALSLESSLGLGCSPAHIVSGRWQEERVEVRMTLFAYGQDYQNLQSGGYAYSDYQSDTITGSGFIYSDKRRGRSGISVTSKVKLSRRSRLTVDLVRWRNRIARRECAAIRIAVEKTNLFGRRGRLRVAGVWEDFDMTRRGDRRAGVSISATIPEGRKFTLRSFHKVENRLSGLRSRVSLRTGAAAELSLASEVSATCTAEYFDPDTHVRRNGYLNLSIGQEVEHAKFSRVATSLRARYYPQNGRFSNWEVRVSLRIGR